MGRPKANTVKVYIRFHHVVDEALEKYAQRIRMTKAGAARWLISYSIAYVRQVRIEQHRENEPVTPEDFYFDGTEEAYFPHYGRSEGRQIGKGTILTFDRDIEDYLQLYAAQLGMTPNHFRMAIVVPYLEGRRRW